MIVPEPLPQLHQHLIQLLSSCTCAYDKPHSNEKAAISIVGCVLGKAGK